MRQFVSLCTIIALVSGCQTSTHERLFMTLAPTEPPITKNVHYAGEYRLYSNAPRNPTTQIASPILEARLAKGDLLGFTRSETGHVLAVIRTDQKPLPDASAAYTWTIQPDAGQFDPDRTILLVVCVIGIIGIGIGISVASAPPIFN